MCDYVLLSSNAYECPLTPIGISVSAVFAVLVSIASRAFC